jgi:hypothetical protein
MVFRSIHDGMGQMTQSFVGGFEIGSPFTNLSKFDNLRRPLFVLCSLCAFVVDIRTPSDGISFELGRQMIC